MVTVKTNCQVNVIGPITKITFSSQPTCEDWILGLESIAERYRSKLVMWVFCEGVTLSSDDLRVGVERINSFFPTTSKLAFVFKQDPLSGMVHLYSLFREHSLINAMIFWYEEEAKNWLLEDCEFNS